MLVSSSTKETSLSSPLKAFLFLDMWKFFINDQEVDEPHGWFGADFNNGPPETVTWNHSEANHILIPKNAPINTSVFEEVEVVE